MTRDASCVVRWAKGRWKRVSLTCACKSCSIRSSASAVHDDKTVRPRPSGADNVVGNTHTIAYGNVRGDFLMPAKCFASATDGVRVSKPPCRFKHQMGMAQLRVRGIAKVTYVATLRALGLNIQQVAAYRAATGYAGKSGNPFAWETNH